MKLLAVLACGSIPLVAFAVASPPATSDLKCAHVPVLFPDAPEPVYVLDGSAVDRDSLERVNPDRIVSIEVICADKVYERFGIKAQRTGLIVSTSQKPYSELKSAMDSIAGLQSAFLARTGRFASTVNELGWIDKSGRVTVEVTLLEDGSRWTATGIHKLLKNLPVTVSGQRVL